MSRWRKKYDDHPIHETIWQIKEWVELEFDTVDQDFEIERRRLKKILNLLSQAVSGVDPEVFPEQEFTNIHNALRHQNFWGQLTNLSSNPNSSHFRNANDHINSQLPRIFAIGALAHAPEEVDRIGALESQFDNFAERATTAINSFDGKVTNLNEAVNELELANNTLRDKQTNFIEVSKREFEDSLREMSTAAEMERNNISEKHKSDADDQVGKLTEFVDSAKKDMSSKHEAIKSLHDIVVGDGVAGGYKKAATEEKKSADKWRRFAVSSFVFAGFWALIKYYMVSDVTNSESLNWVSIVAATSVTVILITLATYAAAQSKLHRINEQQMHWFSLEVAALDPFVDSLTEEDKRKLKFELAHRLFGNDRVTATRKLSKSENTHIEGLVDKVMNLTKEKH